MVINYAFKSLISFFFQYSMRSSIQQQQQSEITSIVKIHD
jgi:hypothetical protein